MFCIGITLFDGNKKNLRITLYHGTTKKIAYRMLESGSRNQFVTTEPNTAKWYGAWKVEDKKEKPVVIKINAPISDVIWVDDYGQYVKPANMQEIEEERKRNVGREIPDYSKSRYLKVTGYIKPSQLKLLTKR